MVVRTVKPIRIELDFQTLVFLMKSSKNLYVQTFDDSKPSIELKLANGEHAGSLGDTIRILEEEWDSA